MIRQAVAIDFDLHQALQAIFSEVESVSLKTGDIDFIGAGRAVEGERNRQGTQRLSASQTLTTGNEPVTDGLATNHSERGLAIMRSATFIEWIQQRHAWPYSFLLIEGRPAHRGESDPSGTIVQCP